MTEKDKQLSHLKKDQRLKKVILSTVLIQQEKREDLYFMLLRAIAGQQLSVKAANTIWQRFLKLFKDAYPDPKKLIRMSDEKLRGAGLSYQKAGYLKNIARFSIDHSLSHNDIHKKTNEELIDYLIQIKGVGKWTAEMILMFGLNREDVFPKDDLGIQNGMKKLYTLESLSKKELLIRMTTISEKWRPYRTLACLYIWRYKDNQ